MSTLHGTQGHLTCIIIIIIIYLFIYLLCLLVNCYW